MCLCMAGPRDAAQGGGNAPEGGGDAAAVVPRRADPCAPSIISDMCRRSLHTGLRSSPLRLRCRCTMSWSRTRRFLLHVSFVGIRGSPSPGGEVLVLGAIRWTISDLPALSCREFAPPPRALPETSGLPFTFLLSASRSGASCSSSQSLRDLATTPSRDVSKKTEDDVHVGIPIESYELTHGVEKDCG